MKASTLDSSPREMTIGMFSRLPVEVVFDTARYPPPSGLAQRDVTTRHLLFQTDELCLDLHLERFPKTSKAKLVGQLADRQDPLKPVTEVTVYLISGKRMLGQAVSDRHGEFQVRYAPERDMTLCVIMHGGKVLEVPIDRRMTQRVA